MLMHTPAAELSECSVGSMGDAGRMLHAGVLHHERSEEQHEGIGWLLLSLS